MPSFHLEKVNPFLPRIQSRGRFTDFLTQPIPLGSGTFPFQGLLKAPTVFTVRLQHSSLRATRLFLFLTALLQSLFAASCFFSSFPATSKATLPKTVPGNRAPATSQHDPGSLALLHSPPPPPPGDNTSSTSLLSKSLVFISRPFLFGWMLSSVAIHTVPSFKTMGAPSAKRRSSPGEPAEISPMRLVAA